MRAGSLFISFVLTVCFATTVPDLTARAAAGRTRAATAAMPDSMGRRGVGQATVPEPDAVSVQSPEASASSIIRIRMRENGRMLVPVAVSDSGTHAFLLDTGAAVTMLNHRLAKRLGMAPTKQVWVYTFAGRVPLSAGRVDSLRIGNFQVVGSDVLIGDPGHLFNITPEADGILGQDVLSRFNYVIDRRAASLEIEEHGNLAAALTGTKVRFEKWGGIIFVLAATGALRLMLDSGTPYPVIYEDAATRCGAVLTISGGERTVRSSLGRQVVRPTRLLSLEIGDSVLRNVDAYLMMRPSGRLEDGLLPLHIFDSVYVNNLENFLIANPRLNRVRRVGNSFFSEKEAGQMRAALTGRSR